MEEIIKQIAGIEQSIFWLTVAVGFVILRNALKDLTK